MKPPEILSMIEEAAGTRMFELKRLNALKTIEKKDKKAQNIARFGVLGNLLMMMMVVVVWWRRMALLLQMEEITKVLSEEISPTLEKLRGERSTYVQWTNNNQEMEKLTRFCIALDYSKAWARSPSAGIFTTASALTVAIRCVCACVCVCVCVCVCRICLQGVRTT
jgi:structural maintenance of chromosome 2